MLGFYKALKLKPITLPPWQLEVMAGRLRKAEETLRATTRDYILGGPAMPPLALSPLPIPPCDHLDWIVLPLWEATGKGEKGKKGKRAGGDAARYHDSRLSATQLGDELTMLL